MLDKFYKTPSTLRLFSFSHLVSFSCSLFARSKLLNFKQRERESLPMHKLSSKLCSPTNQREYV
ncbi:hypothetical protein [Escherichia phage dw-ec]|nr:hypothetical protein [Escherichia phage dw-ec]